MKSDIPAGPNHSTSDPQVLVTGASGLLGNNVVRALAGQGFRVRAMIRNASVDHVVDGLNVDIVRGDVRNPEHVGQACHDVSYVVHAAAQVSIGWSTAEGHWDVNVEGTRYVAAQSRRNGARLIHVSTVNTLAVADEDAPADETTPRTGREINSNYVASKRAAEQVVRKEMDAGLDAIIVYPGFMLGPWDWKTSSGQMFLGVTKRFAPFAPRGGCSVCDVRDVAGGIRLALQYAGPDRHFILAGHNLRYLELWRKMAASANARAPLARLGPWGEKWIGAVGDIWGRMSGQEPVINSASMAMGSQFHYYDSGRARRNLGYQTRPWEATVQDAWEWLLAHGYARTRPVRRPGRVGRGSR